ncbi:uncharacterized protein BDR25DRAFT_301631 [Lindgomyces ingoldianus]|uniref:Uncharacterized protein n=1 Tax=Lindgomyces ingoldianus TaxID=673940 RepID=A0ACB6R4U8_9PLEO|nr:uncharacterized protein BDR25DRAFT_301631 [Lindgomyces ingoldianus]KAF2474176.1 hypothetical protein BDR25DRAFT_301631 [Lindgomyces ingoldianus]
MVLRKETPQPNLVPAPLLQAVNNPPYPTTPATELPPPLPSSSDQAEVYSPDLATSPAFRLKALDDTQKQKEEDESDYSDEDWDKTDDEDTGPEDVPNPLKIGGGKPMPATNNNNALPDALRAGPPPPPPPGVPVKKTAEAITPEPTGATSSSYGAVSNSSGSSIPLKTNNPYLRMQATGQSNFGGESSEQVWGDAPTQAQKYGELVELPTMHTPVTPTNGMSALMLNSNVPPYQGSQSPNQPPLISVESASPESAHPRQDSNASSVWASGMDISSLDAAARSYGLPDTNPQEAPPRTWQEQQAWEKSERERKQLELSTAHEAAVRAEQERRHEEEFHRIEQAAKFTLAGSPFEAEHAPGLPPRRSQEQEHPPAMPPRPIDTGVGGSSHPTVESPNTVMNRQRKEHYQIKQIRWYDANKRGIRTSPILTQNANGPCPLLALVNALVLSTPSGVETALVETLRTREQVSLGLLLDAVFDELMSGRRGGAAQELPDVSDLYKFLVTLHTGLNVNPMYVQDPGATDGSSTLIPTFAIRPGGFENTREMRLYRTFDVPLIHGWLPAAGSDAYIAFERVAKTYEDAQHVQFQEEELDAKLQTEGLNSEEQQMFTDIHAIKEFLNRWPTQLTDYGLKTMRDCMKPGQIGILFRNDHFSTLYKDPRTDHLVTLVTDAGYSSHDEIVWESLVDVNGQGSELFSGDFRPVGGNHSPQPRQQTQQVQSLLDVSEDQGWTTVPSRQQNLQAPPSNALSPSQNTAPLSPNSDLSKTEQEDHDLALALQLQEEEDDRHRRSVEERRRRENQLSEEAIATQSQTRPANRRTSRQGENPPLIPPRRNNVQTHRPNNEPAPPPTYEEAATTPQYHPPQGHPANPAAPIRPQGSAYMANSVMQPGPGVTGRRRSSRPIGMEMPLPPRPGRRQSAGVGGAQGVVPEERDKCVVM